MSDYIPNPPNPERDPRHFDRYYEAESGRGLTLVVGILVAIALAAGLMFFTGNPEGGRNDQAQLPSAQERALNGPITTPAPSIAPRQAAEPPAPAAPATPR